MSQEQKEKTKLKVLRQIIRWIWLVLLAILLIAGLICQAPWKVITLLVILLAACTLLPKQYRKWFWSAIGIIVIILIVWVFLPDNNEGWRPYTFDDDLAELEAKYAVPDEDNAAMIYEKILKNFDYNEFDVNLPVEIYDAVHREPWTVEDYPQAALYIERSKEIIDLLFKATQKKKCLFPIMSPIQISDQQIGYPIAMRRWSRLLTFLSNNDVAEGRINDAIKKIYTIYKMGIHVSQQPNGIAMIVGISSKIMAMDNLKKIVIEQNVNKKVLAEIEELLIKDKLYWKATLPKMIDSDKIFCKDVLSRYYEINREDKIRFSRDSFAQLREHWRKAFEDSNEPESELDKHFRDFAYLSYWERKYLKACTIWYWFYLPSNPEKAADDAEEAFEKYYLMVKDDYDWDKEPRSLLSYITAYDFKLMCFSYHRFIKSISGMSEETYHQLYDLYMRLKTDKKGVLLSIGLKRYKNTTGEWPNSLDGIKEFTSEENFVDPANGSSFVYKIIDDSFTLYSKGKNNIDDNGLREKNIYKDGNILDCDIENEGTDDWVIWPQ